MLQKFIEATVVGRTDHTPTLFSLQFEAPLDGFVAGQYCRVGLHMRTDKGDEAVMRPYSLVNAPSVTPNEILLTLVSPAQGGILSPALHALKVGDPLLVGPRTNGFFSMPEVPDAEVLWCLSTGTGLGPYLSILNTPAPWEKFKRVVLVHAVRVGAELVYRDEIALIAARYAERFQYIAFVSREAHAQALPGRIPAAIMSGALEARAGIALDAATAHCMLCGNPEMVTDTIAALELRGMKKHRRKTPGQITTEAYW